MQNDVETPWFPPGKSCTNDATVYPHLGDLSQFLDAFPRNKGLSESFQAHQDALPVLPIAALNGVSVLTNNKALKDRQMRFMLDVKRSNGTRKWCFFLLEIYRQTCFFHVVPLKLIGSSNPKLFVFFSQEDHIYQPWDWSDSSPSL